MGRVLERCLTILLVASIVAAAALAMFGTDGLGRLLQLQAQQRELTARVVARMEENRRLQEAIEHLKHDPAHLETVARRELGLVRPDEIVYRERMRPVEPR